MRTISPVIVVAAAVILIASSGTAQVSDTSSASILSDSSKRHTLEEVTVTGHKNPVQFLPDRTIINVDASISNAGATVMEVLERSPGVTVDRSGVISLKGRRGVLVMIDGKPTQISGAELQNMLTGMAASHVDVIELIDNPPSKYDAAGNAGIINIKTKKNRRRGFNGTVNSALTHGRYIKTFNSLHLNYNTGKLNFFATANGNFNRYFTDLYAIRTYYAPDNTTVLSKLEQPSFFRGNAPAQNIKLGVDFFASPKTTVGMVLSENRVRRTSKGNNPAVWMDATGAEDSVVTTSTNNKDQINSFSANLNLRRVLNTASEITADFDLIGYRINNSQYYNNRLNTGSGYNEEVTGDLHSRINIYTGKADYTRSFAAGNRLEAGWKSSHISTNNGAAYFLHENGSSLPDYGKTNEFIYAEDIHAAYISMELKRSKWTYNGGLRYENTSYDARQLGNPLRKDSSFSRSYDGLFPSMSLNFEPDSLNTFTFTAGRRIDRPAFYSLNPFIFVINKYTYQAGNPYYRPQYTWNTELSHTYKNKLVTSISYSRTRDYFSQVFMQDTSGLIIYTEGNLRRMENFGATVSFQSPITARWSVNATTALNYKKIYGRVWDERRTARLQANFNVASQFVFGRGWTGELSGVYQLHEQELQEITDPTGQVGVGVAKQVLRNQGTLKLSLRDIFYSQAMKGFTVFQQSTEYFSIRRDTRTASIAFIYRFGKNDKNSSRRKTGGAEDEIRRAGGQG